MEEHLQDMLLAIFKYEYSLSTLRDQGWYHIPVSTAPKGWPFDWICFYQGKAFGNRRYCVEYYGEVASFDIVPYHELFPERTQSEKSNRSYYRVRIPKLLRLERPIPSLRPRRLSFVPTTLTKFHGAEQLNDLFDESPLEDSLWQELKTLGFKAERQWLLPVEQQRYFLDFAVFCNSGFIDLEADGDTWHLEQSRVKLDNIRNNAMARMGWQVLRFNGQQIREEMQTYCVPEIEKTVNTLAGLSDDGLVPRVFHHDGSQSSQQLSLFEQRGEYGPDNLDSGASENLEV